MRVAVEHGRHAEAPDRLLEAARSEECVNLRRLAFDVDNPRDDEWEVTFTVEFLDKSGKIIDRAAKKESYEGEAKILNFDHPLLEYVLPLVHEVRVTLQGRLD